MIFEQELITRKCVFTLEGGYKMVATLTIPKPKEAIFPEKLERDFVREYNKAQRYIDENIMHGSMMDYETCSISETPIEDAYFYNGNKE